ncbi:MAG: hypothetical protein ACYC99_11105, partial [Candidatus Geothermincolia bacterium]
HVTVTTLPNAQVASPTPNQLVHGQVDITGTAANPDFQSYVLEWAPGQPADEENVWHLMAQSSSSVEGGLLGAWDTTGVNGPCTVRLTVCGTFGHVNRDRVAVTVDNTGPTVSLAKPTEGELIFGSYSIEGTATDSNNFQWYQLSYASTNDPTTWHPVGALHSTPVVAGVLDTLDVNTLSTGTYVLRLSAVDACDNQSSVTTSFEVDADTPSVGLDSPSSDAVVWGTVSITGTAADAHFGSYTLECSPNGANQWQQIAPEGTTPVSAGVLGSWDTTQVSDGSYDLKLSARDLSGNPSAIILSGIIVDNTAPSAVITDPDPQSTQTKAGTIEIRGTASDQNFSKYRLEYSTSADPGNWLMIGADHADPVTDSVLASWDTTVVMRDNCVLRLTVFDMAGATTVATSAVNIDNKPPEVSITTPCSTQYYGGRFPVTGTVTDTDLVKTDVLVAPGFSPRDGDYELLRSLPVSITDGELAVLDTKVLPDGPTTLKVIAQDAAAHTTTTKVVFYVDNCSPRVSITAPRNNVTVSGQVAVQGTASDRFLDYYVVQYQPGSDPGAGQWIDIGQQHNTSINGGVLALWDTTGLASGPYLVRVRAADRIVRQQSEQNTPEPRRRPTDVVVPVNLTSTNEAGVTINNGAAFTNRRDVTLSLNCPGAKYMQITNDTSGWPTTMEPYATARTWVLGSAEGDMQVRVRFKKNDGTFIEDNDAIGFDKTAPTDLAITTPANNTSIGVNLSIRAIAQDAGGSGIQRAEFIYAYDGAPLAVFGTATTPVPGSPDTYEYTVDTSTLGYGFYDLFVRFYDNAGNVSISAPVSATHFSGETWERPGYDNANTHYSSQFQSDVRGYSNRWNLAPDEYGESRYAPVAAIGVVDGKPEKRVYQLKLVRIYQGGEYKYSYTKILGMDPDDTNSSGIEGLPPSPKIAFSYPTDPINDQMKPSAMPIAVVDGFLFAVSGNYLVRFKVGEEFSREYYDLGEPVVNAPCYLGGGVVLVPVGNDIRAVRLDYASSTVTDLWRVACSGTATTPVVLGSADQMKVACTTSNPMTGEFDFHLFDVQGNNAELVTD